MTEKQKIDMIVGQNIKRERENAGYTQERFSEMIGIGPKSLSAIERGTVGVSLSLLLRVCKTLSISSESLLFPSSDAQQPTDLVQRLSRLPPDQYKAAEKVLLTLMEVFSQQH